MKVFFPYDSLRAEQSKLIKDIFESVQNRKVLLAHAPTGLGKTVSSLAPTIVFALENKLKIFFLTPKISQHEIVLETINLMNEKFGLDIKAVDLVGKKQLCLDPFLSHVSVGFYDACSKKKKEGKCRYYNNAKGKTFKQKKSAAQRKAVVLKEFNKSHLLMKEECFVSELCPYEILLEQCKGADVVIADYSHLFNDDIRENILGSAKISLDKIILIVDEAHNLSERIRDMYTVSVTSESIAQAEKEARSTANFDVELITKDIGKEIVSLGKRLSLDRNEGFVDEIELAMLKKIGKDSLEKIEEAALVYMAKRQIEKCFLMGLVEFIEILLMKKEAPLYFVERKNSLALTITPMDVSVFSGKVINGAHSALLMSGTLLPLGMYADILGIKNHISMEYVSPFPKENRLNLFVDKTTTKYTQRTDLQYKEIADVINAVVPKVPGNTIAFFPSFELMEKISPYISVSRKILRQEREQTSQDKTSLIHNFKLLGASFGGLLLAVSGGSIAEGIDFPGEHLSAAIIVGVPFAKVSLQTNALIKFYEHKFGKGWEYAYNAPAISKAVQAAGRVIRTEKDTGVCIFLDKRFSDKRYEKFFPKDFDAKKTLFPEKDVQKFFG